MDIITRDLVNQMDGVKIYQIKGADKMEEQQREEGGSGAAIFLGVVLMFAALIAFII